MQLFFEPRSVVLVGTSRQTGHGAYNNPEMLLCFGYPGRIYLVHPSVPDIMGYKTCPRVAAAPRFALFVIPGNRKPKMEDPGPGSL